VKIQFGSEVIEVTPDDCHRMLVNAIGYIELLEGLRGKNLRRNAVKEKLFGGNEKLWERLAEQRKLA